MRNHAYYGGHEAIIALEMLDILEEALPKRVKALVIKCTIDHRQALLEDWKLVE